MSWTSALQINLWGETPRCRWQSKLAFVVVVTNLHACPRSLSSLLFISNISRVEQCQQNSLSSGKILAFFSPLLDSPLVLAQKVCQYNLHRYLIFPCFLSSYSSSLQPFNFFLINILMLRKALTGVCECFNLEVILSEIDFEEAKVLLSLEHFTFDTNASSALLRFIIFIIMWLCSHRSPQASCWNCIPFRKAREKGGLQEFVLTMTLNAHFPHIFPSTNSKNSPLAQNLIQLSCIPQ